MTMNWATNKMNYQQKPRIKNNDYNVSKARSFSPQEKGRKWKIVTHSRVNIEGRWRGGRYKQNEFTAPSIYSFLMLIKPLWH